MNAPHDRTVDTAPRRRVSATVLRGLRPEISQFFRAEGTALRSPNAERRFAQWGCLMVAAQGGEGQAYNQWLRQ